MAACGRDGELKTNWSRTIYRQTHATFEDYCRERWGMSKTHANRMIDSAEVVSNLTPIGVIPNTESQARPSPFLNLRNGKGFTHRAFSSLVRQWWSEGY